QRYNLDSRDQGAGERLEVLSDHEGIWGCTFVGECTKVCPKHVDPAAAIQRYKLKATLEWLKAFFLPRGARWTNCPLIPSIIPAGIARGSPPTGGSSAGPMSSSSCGN